MGSNVQHTSVNSGSPGGSCSAHDFRPLTGGIERCAACGHLRALSRTALNPGLEFFPLSLGPGEILRDRYQLVDLLGRGAHGITFLAQHQLLDHLCVVKLLPFRAGGAAQDAVDRLRTEAAAGFRVSHPNVVRVLDCDAHRGDWFLVTEFVDGVDLGQILATGARMPWQQVAEAALHAARGLRAIHQIGLIHRDIKPSNLILGVDGVVRVADLGLVGFMWQRPEFARSSQPERAGTLPYAAPEMCEGNSGGPGVDLYSLGVTLFELLCGRRPFPGGMFGALLNTRGAAAPSWTAAEIASAPAWLRELIDQLLDAQPARRPPCADSVVWRLEQQLGAAKPSAPRPTSVEPDHHGVVVPVFEVRGAAQAANDNEWLAQALAEHLSHAFASAPGGYVADRDQFQATLGRLRSRGSDRGEANLRRAARVSGATFIIQGGFERDGAALRLEASLLRIDSAAVIRVPAVSGIISELPALENALLLHLREAMADTGVDMPAELPPRAVPWEAEARFFAARRAYLRGNYEEAIALAHEALALKPDYAEPTGFIGVCSARMGRYEEAAEWHRRQQALASVAADARLNVEAHANLGTMYYFRGVYESAYQSLSMAVSMAEGVGLTSEVAMIRNNLGFVMLQLGRASEAESIFRLAAETHRRFGALVALIGPYNGLGHVARDQGRYEQARSSFLEALALAEESDDLVNVGVAYMNLGHCALLEQRRGLAKRELLIALNLLEQTRFWNGLGRVYEHMAGLNMQVGDWAEALRCADRRIELARRHRNLRMEQGAWKQKAEALRLAGRHAEAVQCEQQALGQSSAA